jgi:membrane protein YdbS with pleckstrin-like domain
MTSSEKRIKLMVLILKILLVINVVAGAMNALAYVAESERWLSLCLAYLNLLAVAVCLFVLVDGGYVGRRDRGS